MATVTRRTHLSRVVLLTAGCTLALTASFVGLVALATAAAEGVINRLPFYVLTTAIVFVTAIVLLEAAEYRGERILGIAAILGVGSFLVISLSAEGTVFAMSHPDRVIASQLVFYFLSGGLIATGLGYWGVRHWRDLTSRPSNGL